MKFNPGDLAFVKTTSEKVIVLGVAQFNPNNAFDVRRPVATKDNGLQHVEETFFEFELEAFDEQLAREFSDMEKVESLRAKLQAGAKAAGHNQTVPLVN